MLIHFVLSAYRMQIVRYNLKHAVKQTVTFFWPQHFWPHAGYSQRHKWKLIEAPSHGVIGENAHTGNITCKTMMEYMAADMENYIEIAHDFGVFQPMLVHLDKHVHIYHLIAFFLQGTFVRFRHPITPSHCRHNESVHRKERLATRINTISIFFDFIHVYFFEAMGSMQYRPPIGHQNLHWQC